MAVYYFFVLIFHVLFICEVSDFGHCKQCNYKHFFACEPQTLMHEFLEGAFREVKLLVKVCV